jgi:capsular polysaccharide biosynthesis protein
MFSKTKRWADNPVGAFERFLEFAYFGQPMFNLFIGNRRDLEQIMHMSKSVNTIESNENLIFLDKVRVELYENFIQLDTGHILNSRLAPNAIFSGEHWNLIRDIRKSKVASLQIGTFYPIAKQKYFYHFLVEDLPEIISMNQSDLDITFVTLKGQSKFVLELCEIAGVKVEILNTKIQLFERLVVPTYSRVNSKWSIDKLMLLKKGVDYDQPNVKKLLLLRKGKVRSDEDFERSLYDFLEPFGYKVIDPDEYSNQEQIKIFSKASEIVAIHGAALANLVFSNTECRIFEIFNHPYRMYVFRDLAKLNGNAYTSAEVDSAFSTLKTWLDGPAVQKGNL